MAGKPNRLLAATMSLGSPGRPAGLWISEDAGASWQRIGGHLFSGGATGVTVSGRWAMVTLGVSGVACSADGGISWRKRC